MGCRRMKKKDGGGTGVAGRSDYDRIHGEGKSQIKGMSRRTSARSPWGKKRGATSW